MYIIFRWMSTCFAPNCLFVCSSIVWAMRTGWDDNVDDDNEAAAVWSFVLGLRRFNIGIEGVFKAKRLLFDSFCFFLPLDSVPFLQRLLSFIDIINKLKDEN